MIIKITQNFDYHVSHFNVSPACVILQTFPDSFQHCQLRNGGLRTKVCRTLPTVVSETGGHSELLPLQRQQFCLH